MNSAAITSTPPQHPTPIRPESPKRQTAKEIVTANVKALIEQLEAGRSDALTAYLNAMGTFSAITASETSWRSHVRSRTPRAWPGCMRGHQLGRKVRKGERGIRILAPLIGIRRKPEGEAEKDITAQNRAVLVGFRNAYVFDVSQTRRRGTAQAA